MNFRGKNYYWTREGKHCKAKKNGVSFNRDWGDLDFQIISVHGPWYLQNCFNSKYYNFYNKGDNGVKRYKAWEDNFFIKRIFKFHSHYIRCIQPCSLVLWLLVRFTESLHIHVFDYLWIRNFWVVFFVVIDRWNSQL